MNIMYSVESIWQFGLLYLVQSTLLILLAFLAVRLCRIRDAAVLSVVYRFTMLAVLVSPLVTRAMMQTQVDGWWPNGTWFRFCESLALNQWEFFELFNQGFLGLGFFF